MEQKPAQLYRVKTFKDKIILFYGKRNEARKKNEKKI